MEEYNEHGVGWQNGTKSMSVQHAEQATYASWKRAIRVMSMNAIAKNHP